MSTVEKEKAFYEGHCKGNAKSKIQWVVKKWSTSSHHKWECGWFDEDKKQIFSYHYIKDHAGAFGRVVLIRVK
eukprot:g16261.t1